MPVSTHEEPEEVDRHEPEAEDEAVVESPRHPTGKGVFIQSVKGATKAGTPEALAAFCEDLGMDWVMLQCIWQHKDRDNIYEKVEEAAAELKARGIKVWLWCWPHRDPGRIPTLLDIMADRVDAIQPEGIVWNIEVWYYGSRRKKPKYAKQARYLMEQARIAFPTLTFGLSSYGAKFWHTRSFPFSVFAEFCAFGMPQIYDTDHKFGAGYPEKCFLAWEKIFAIVIATWGASKAHTAQQMEDFISRTPRSVAGSHWDLNHLRYSRKRQAVVRDYEVS